MQDGGCSLVIECLLSFPGSLGSSPRTGWGGGGRTKPNRRVCEESPKATQLGFLQTGQNAKVTVNQSCLDVMVDACNSTTWEAEAGELLQIWGQSGLCS